MRTRKYQKIPIWNEKSIVSFIIIKTLYQDFCLSIKVK